MIVALFPNMKKPETAEIAGGICAYLLSRGVEVVAEEENASLLGVKSLKNYPLQNIDFVITLGGDGTILRLMHRHPTLLAPIMPINMGNLGFMADITLDETYLALENLLAGKFTIQNRIAIEGHYDGQSFLAVNDVVIHRGANPSLIDLAMYVDDVYVNTFAADGIIIATPSGSTAYSLSAGGPIVSPDLQALILTPICPHTISNRPIVLFPKNNIRIELIGPEKPVDAIFDGFPSATIKKGCSLVVTHAKRQFSLVCMPGHDYFATLRTKLGWAGKVRQ